MGAGVGDEVERRMISGEGTADDRSELAEDLMSSLAIRCRASFVASVSVSPVSEIVKAPL